MGRWTRLCDVAVALAVLLVIVFFANERMPSHLETFLALRVTLKNELLLAGFVVIWPTMMTVAGAYDAARTLSLRSVATTALAGCTLGSLCATIIPFTSNSGKLGTAIIPIIWIGTFIATMSVRFGSRIGMVVSRVRRRPRRVLIAGVGPRAAALWADLRAHPFLRYELVAVADLPDAHAMPSFDGFTRVDLANLEGFCMNAVVDEVIIALPVRSRYQEIDETLRICQRTGIHSQYLADTFAPTIARSRVSNSGHFSVVSMHVVQDDWRLAVKRLMDIFVSGLLLVVLSPLLLGLAAAVKLTSSGPVIFAQERYGFRKRRFRMLKFRTMVPDAERLQAALEDRNEAGGPVFKIQHDPRVTPIGRFLRRASLDELPQLWNVFKGDMSLVGPRPLPIRDVTRFDAPWLMRRFSVRPGLTCIWQVSGRSNLSFEDWITLDLQYIDRWSLGLDFSLLLRTIPAVLSGSGAK